MSGQNKKHNQTGPPNKRTYVDSETGKKVNDYIPAFISNKPWYFNDNQETLKTDSNSRKRKTEDEMYKEISDKANDRLKHQRLNGEQPTKNQPTPGSGIDDNLEIVQQASGTSGLSFKDSANSKKNKRYWLKNGLCENCGGKHKKIECLEKPHKRQFVNRQNSESSTILAKKETTEWDVKRDRWRDIDLNEEYSGIVDSLKKKEQMALEKLGDNASESNDTDLIVKAVTLNNPLAIKETDDVKSRDIGDKPRYLEVIKTGEELRYNPKSRVYKDLDKGYLNERGQFIPFLTGEAAEFEKMKKFTRVAQNEHLKNQKGVKDKEKKPVSDKQFSNILSPTTTMLKLKEKSKKDEIVRKTKEKEFMNRYG